MKSKEEIMQILSLETADFDSPEGVAELLRRVEKVHGAITSDLIHLKIDSLSGENAGDLHSLLAAIKALLEDKRAILKNAECDLKPIAWDQIQDIQREWLIPNWLPANTVTMFTGQGGAGKSSLTLQVACQIASHAAGMAWGDKSYQTPQVSESNNSIEQTPQPIVFATYEDEPAEIKRRLNALSSSFKWIKKERNVIQQHLHIVDMRGIGSVWGPGAGNHIAITGELLRSGEALRKVCEDLSAKLLVLDPLSGAFGGNENDRTAVYDFVSSFRGWGDAAKCAMLVIGHLPKTQGVGFSGSTAWEASARAMWMLSKQNAGDNKDPKEYYALEHTKSNYAPLQQERYLVKSSFGWWEEVGTQQEAINGYSAFKEYQMNKSTQQESDDDLTKF